MKRYRPCLSAIGDASYTPDENGKLVLYSEAQARIEALEWLAQAQVLWLGSISWESTWCDACVSDAGHKECRDIYLCARAAAGV